MVCEAPLCIKNLAMSRRLSCIVRDKETNSRRRTINYTRRFDVDLTRDDTKQVSRASGVGLFSPGSALGVFRSGSTPAWSLETKSPASSRADLSRILELQSAQPGCNKGKISEEILPTEWRERKQGEHFAKLGVQLDYSENGQFGGGGRWKTQP